ncbi:MAG TPA: FKBP-type peptidyl-prolyl cis-trans isomerase [Pyrinomonadaceae bacterium]|nr:FKBP-type peptidyl-prolyl cis-trans isomerase [Pyrinomonadaceae bacterium]
MKPLTIFIIALIALSPGTITGPPAQGQTNKRRVPRHRARKTKHSPVGANAFVMRRTPSGLLYVITRRSTGQLPRSGETVIVNYTGLLGSGEKFDSSLDRGQPFKLGAGHVIKGWDEGIAKLRVGEQATLIIPPELGYGAKGAGGVIPPDATLIFIVELMGVEEAQVLK